MNASINKTSVSVEDLNALVGSRICHDLISPLGAISNGVELLNMTGANTAPEVALIAESVENANARIRYFRVAFGATNEAASFSHGEAVSILKDAYKSSRTSVSWRVSGDITRAEVKLAFLLIQCLDSAMPRGGTIDVTRSNITWSIKGTAARLRIVDALWARLSQNVAESDIAAADVHFALAAPTADQMRRRINVAIIDEEITVSF